MLSISSPFVISQHLVVCVMIVGESARGWILSNRGCLTGLLRVALTKPPSTKYVGYSILPCPGLCRAAPAMALNRFGMAPILSRCSSCTGLSGVPRRALGLASQSAAGSSGRSRTSSSGLGWAPSPADHGPGGCHLPEDIHILPP